MVMGNPPDFPPPGTCRWIDGDVKAGTSVWCGKPAIRGTAWCPEHRARVYVRVPEPALKIQSDGEAA